MLKYVLFLLCVFSAVTTAQDRCSKCRQEITGQFIAVEGLFFHPEHFLCHECKLPIEGSYSKRDGFFVHPECSAKAQGMACAVCGKALEGTYIKADGKSYHQNCFENSVAQKCAVCLKPITGDYITDIYSNMYHAEHKNESPQCENCSRLISENLSLGGYDYKDGRHICGKCYNSAIFDEASIQHLVRKVVSALRGLGFETPMQHVTFTAVDRIGLQKAAGSKYTPSMRGICNASTKTTTIKTENRRSTKREEKSFRVYVLNGVPAVNIEATIAHELMHVWMYQNTDPSFTHPLLEGLCNYTAYLYLSTVNSFEASILIKGFTEDPDPVYGDGFRVVRSKFEGKPVNSFLRYAVSGN
ncbi:MAG: protein DA1 [Ignavibacteriales bacterium]|nr:protein DA1 [Ignavibacteriales bacterium]